MIVPSVRFDKKESQNLNLKGRNRGVTNTILFFIEEKLIEEEAIFIDGMMIEVNANKFTFVWRKSIEKYSAKLIEKSNQM